jgi:hypothetical protein
MKLWLYDVLYTQWICIIDGSNIESNEKVSDVSTGLNSAYIINKV